ncbi:hypothetical protein QQ045_007023 [Rhodiola kirilowii]
MDSQILSEPIKQRSSEYDDKDASTVKPSTHETGAAASVGTNHTTYPSCESGDNATVAPLGCDPETMLRVKAEIANAWDLMCSRSSNLPDNQN